MRFDELNESNYMLFAIKFYDNPQAVTKDDFESDLKRIRYFDFDWVPYFELAA